jgi:aromatic-L-amino-acid decarboxylase
MTPEEFRQAGHQLIDWITDYRLNIEQHPVRAQVRPGEIRNALPPTPPEQPEELEELMSDLDNIIVPGLTQVQHPMHFGWFPANASLAAVLGDITSAGLGTLGISWESCPALTEVEEVVCDWMRQLTGLSEQWEGTIHDTASTACLTALLVARERASNYSQARDGLQGEAMPLVVYASAQAHSSVNKAALLAGFGKNNVRVVAHNPTTFSMNADALRAAMQADRDNNSIPAAVVASSGSTGVVSFDPVDAIVEVASEFGAWVHVDAAMAGTAMLLPECRQLWKGVEGADSLSWNPHKWMGTLLDTSLFYVRDPQTLIRVMSTNPSYLRSNVDAEVTQYRDWGIPLGRRFRALKLWFHLRLDGPEAIRERIRRDLDNAHWLEQQVREANDWQVVAPVTLQTVCVRHQPGNLEGEALDQHTLRWVDAINHSGKAFLSPSLHEGQWMVRISIGSEMMTREHVAALWSLLRSSVESQKN